MGSNKSWIQNNILILEIIGSKNLGSNYFQSVKNIIFFRYPDFQLKNVQIMYFVNLVTILRKPENTGPKFWVNFNSLD